MSTDAKTTWTELLKKRETVALFLVLGMALALLVRSGNFFLDPSNLDSLQAGIAPKAIIAIGMMVLLISGMFDLSVGSVMGFSGVVTAICMTKGVPMPIAILAGLGTGLVFGLVNGLLIAIARVNPLIATIGTMYIARGLSEVLLVRETREGLTELDPTFIWLGAGKFLGLYHMFWVMIILIVLAQLFLRKAYPGRQLYYVGGNREAAGLLGMNVTRIRLLAYCFSGFMAALAGILDTTRSEMANRYMGQGVEMKVIVACLIGGGSIAGGKGSAVGALLGVTFMSLLNNSFTLWEVGKWQNAVLGMVLVSVVVSDGYLTLRKQRALGKA